MWHKCGTEGKSIAIRPPKSGTNTSINKHGKGSVMSIHEVIRNGKKKHVVKLRRPDGTQYSRTFKSHRDAKAYEAEEIEARNKGIWIDRRRSAITFGALAELWLKQNPDKRQRTLERDTAILKKHVLPTLGDQPILGIKHSQIQTLVNTWSNGGLKPRTIQRQIAVMKAVFQRAVDDDLIVKSPIKSLRVPKALPVVHHPLSADAAARILNAVEPFYRPLMYIFLTTGLRWSELAGLQIRDVTLIGKEPTLRIERGLHMTSTGHKYEPPKSNAGQRSWPLSEQQIHSISAHLATTKRTMANQDEPLFTSPKGSHLVYSNFRQRVFLPAIKRAGIPNTVIHDIRRTTATVLVAGQVDMKTIQELMGHSDIRTTMNLYASATPAGRQNAVDALQKHTAPADNQVDNLLQAGEQ